MVKGSKVMICRICNGSGLMLLAGALHQCPHCYRIQECPCGCGFVVSAGTGSLNGPRPADCEIEALYAEVGGEAGGA